MLFRLGTVNQLVWIFLLRDFSSERQSSSAISLQQNTGPRSFGRRGTLYGTFVKAKMSFIAYPFFKPFKYLLRYGTVRILPKDDIATMKVIAISQRGRKRDFVDLYWFCINQRPLSDIIRRAASQYPGQKENINYILRSLTYFADVDQDPMPKLFFKANWWTIKQYFQREVPRITKEFLGLR